MGKDIWIVSGSPVYHTDAGCRGVSTAKNPRATTIEALNGHREHCTFCSGEYDYADEGGPATEARYLDPAELTPREDGDNVHLGVVWTQRGFIGVDGDGAHESGVRGDD